MKQVDRVGAGVLDEHATGVAFDEVGGSDIEMVCRQQSGLVVAHAGDGEPADGPRVAAQAGLRDSGRH